MIRQIQVPTFITGGNYSKKYLFSYENSPVSDYYLVAPPGRVLHNYNLYLQNENIMIIKKILTYACKDD